MSVLKCFVMSQWKAPSQCQDTRAVVGSSLGPSSRPERFLRPWAGGRGGLVTVACHSGWGGDGTFLGSWLLWAEQGEEEGWSRALWEWERKAQSSVAWFLGAEKAPRDESGGFFHSHPLEARRGCPLFSNPGLSLFYAHSVRAPGQEEGVGAQGTAITSEWRVPGDKENSTRWAKDIPPPPQHPSPRS